MTKNTEEKFQPAIVGRRFVAQRLVGTNPSLPLAFLKVAQSISSELSVPSLCFASARSSPIDLSEASISAWLAEIELHHRDEIFTPRCLSDHLRKPTIQLFLGDESTPIPIDEISFRQPEQFPLQALLRTMRQVCLEFGAFYGYVSDSLLSELHERGIRGYELALAKVRPEDPRFYLKPLPFEGIIDTLPPLLLRWEFDFTQVPDGVWWINFWSAQQVEIVSRESIESVDWFQVVECQNGSMILVLTGEPTDLRNSEHLEKLSQVVERLELRKLQEQYRITCDRYGVRI